MVSREAPMMHATEDRLTRLVPVSWALTATDVVVSGCSAGGLAVYLHIDEIADLFKGKETKVRGLAGRYCGHWTRCKQTFSHPIHYDITHNTDSGFFQDQDLNGCRSAQSIRWLAQRQGCPAGKSDCLKTYSDKAIGKETSWPCHLPASAVPLCAYIVFFPTTLHWKMIDALDAYKCMFAQYIIPSLRTPVFSWMSRFDGAQMTSFNCLQKTDVKEVNKFYFTFKTCFLSDLIFSRPHNHTDQWGREFICECLLGYLSTYQC